MTKEELVQKLNQTLGMSRPLAHWQFLQVRKWELEQIVQRASALREQAEKYQDALQAVLTAEHRQQGFRLAEDEDFVYLYRHDKLVATFSSQGAAPEAIREAADKELSNP